MKKLKIILTISIILNIIAVSFAIRRVYYMRQGEILSKDPIKAFDINPTSNDNIVFMGDSHTEWFDLQKAFGDENIQNRGIGGYNTIDLLKLLPKAVSGHPKKLFIEIGFNDLRQNIPIDTIAKNINKIVTYIKDKSPATIIYLHTIPPYISKHYQLNKNAALLNKYITDLAYQKGCTLIDINSNLSHNGSVIPDYVRADSVHLNEKAYVKWVELLKPYL